MSLLITTRSAAARRLLGAALLAACAAPACAPSIYTLPPPPPEAEWAAVSLVPGEDEKASQRRYIDARAAALELYAALKSKRWGEVWQQLSSETQAALAFAHPTQDGQAALSEGVLVYQDGARVAFDPMDAWMVPDLKTFEDQLPGEQEAESDTRKEIFAVDRDGHHRKMIMILEAGEWKLHKTRLP